MTHLAALFMTFSAVYGLPPGLIDSVCWVESGWRPGVVHRDDGRGHSKGICQVKESTAKFVGVHGDLMEPATNIHAAAAYLAYQIKRYHGNVRRAVAAYNRGYCAGNGINSYTRKVWNEWNRSSRKARRY